VNKKNQQNFFNMPHLHDPTHLSYQKHEKRKSDLKTPNAADSICPKLHHAGKLNSHDFYRLVLKRSKSTTN
jgi:hypothetical protein